VHRYTKKISFLIVSSSIFIAAGLFPFIWFTLIKSLLKMFNITITS